MADILIKNVDDANGKRCFDCEFEYRFCCELLFATNVDGLLEDDVLEKKKDRDSRCNMNILPPHGEAKDTDIAIRYIKEEMEDDFNETTTLDEKSYKEGMKRAIELIGYAPTVLEATE